MLGAPSPAPADSADVVGPPGPGDGEDDIHESLPHDDLDLWEAWSVLGDVGHNRM